MNLPNLNYVIGNTTSTSGIDDRQMEATSSHTVAVSSKQDENEKPDQWSVVPKPKDGAIVSFQSEAFQGSYLTAENNGSLTCTANLSADAKEFKLTYAGLVGNEETYYIQLVNSSHPCDQKYLSMDDPQTGKPITLETKMTSETHKQKWKFKSASGTPAEDKR